MPVRRTATWTSLTGDQYKVELLDSTLPGDSTDTMELGTDGFQLRYEGKPDDLLNLIIPSSVSLSVLIQSSIDESLISDIANSAEGRFSLRIYKYNVSAFTLFWAGIIISDLSEWQDAAYPFLYVMKAIDGLSRLKEITYSPPASFSFIDHLAQVLGQLNIVQFWAATDTFFSTTSNWYSYKMFTTAPPATLDPLKASAVGINTYTYLDNDKQRQYMNCFDVLKQILQQWNLRIFLSNGRFFLIQVNQLVAGGTVNFHNYDITGGYLADESITLGQTSFNRKGSFRFLRPVKKISFLNSYWMQSQSERLPSQPDYITPVSTGLFSSGNAETITFSGKVDITMTDSASDGGTTILHFKLLMKIGAYYLGYNGLNYYWTTDSTTRVDVYSPAIINFNGTPSIVILFTTQALQEMGEGSFSFDLYQYEDDTGTAITLPSTVTCTIAYWGFSLQQSLADGKQPYSATSSYTGTLFEKKLPDLLTGDGPSSDDKGKITVLDTSSAWVEARGDWTAGGTGTGTWLNQLMAQKSLALLALAIRKYHGTIENGNILAHHVISFDSKNYALLAGTFYPNYDRWTGDWAEVTEN
jgi:hypothetical protein